MTIDEGEHPGTPRRKHRHDLGHEDHGAKLAAGAKAKLDESAKASASLAKGASASVKVTAPKVDVKQSAGASGSPSAPTAATREAPATSGPSAAAADR